MRELLAWIPVIVAELAVALALSLTVPRIMKKELGEKTAARKQNAVFLSALTRNTLLEAQIVLGIIILTVVLFPSWWQDVFGELSVPYLPALLFLCALLLVSVAVLLWRNIRIVYDASGFAYTNGFGRTRRFDWAEVKTVSVGRSVRIVTERKTVRFPITYPGAQAFLTACRANTDRIR